MLGPQLRRGQDEIVSVDVSGLAGGVRALELGGDNTCALTSLGASRAGARIGHGQLGNLSPSNSSVPVAIAGLASGVTEIAVGGQHICALDGRWGELLGFQHVRPARRMAARAAHGTAVDRPGRYRSTASPCPRRAVGQPRRQRAGSTTRRGRPTLCSDSTMVLTWEWASCLAKSSSRVPNSPCMATERSSSATTGAQLPPAEGPIIRGRPFRIGQLDEEQVQSLLRFALGEGGLGDACERYETRPSTTLALRSSPSAPTVSSKRVEVFGGEAPFGPHSTTVS